MNLITAIIMVSFFIISLTVVLVLLSLFLLLVVLMQRSGSDIGTAMGGGAIEGAFGVATTNVLTRATSYGLAAFFVIAFALYLVILGNTEPVMLESGVALPEISLTSLPVEERENAVVESSSEDISTKDQAPAEDANLEVLIP